MAKVKIFESKQTDKNGRTTTAIHIMGSSVPEPKLKVVKNAKVKKLKNKNEQI